MSGYSEVLETHTCSNCGTVNHVVIAYSGDDRANERESVECCKCGSHLHSEKCWTLFSGETQDAALLRLRKLQKRA